MYMRLQEFALLEGLLTHLSKVCTVPTLRGL